MRVRSHLLVLPVHRRSLQEYHRSHDALARELAKEVEKEWKQPFEQLPPHVQLHWRDQWYWPPWFFNDAVGFLKIGSDADRSIAGDLFLERQCFSPTAMERFSRGEEKAREIVYFSGTAGYAVEEGDRASWIDAVRRVIEEAQRVVRTQAHGLDQAVVWRPEYGLECFDFEEAERQLADRS